MQKTKCSGYKTFWNYMNIVRICLTRPLHNDSKRSNAEKIWEKFAITARNVQLGPFLQVKMEKIN